MAGVEPEKIFEQTAGVAAEFMMAREIVDSRSGNRVRIDDVLAYQQVGNQYNAMDSIPSGYLWTPRRRTLQSLVVLKPEFKPGSCVRIIRSSYFDLTTRQYVPGEAERDTAENLGMSADEIARLEFDPEEKLFHLIRGPRLVTSKDFSVPSITPQDADRDLDKFLL